MALNLRNMLAATRTMVAALPTMVATSAQIYMVVPLSLAARINAIIVLGPATPHDSTMGGGQDWEPEVGVIFAYRVSDSDPNAELILCDLVLELTNAVLVNDPTIGGTVDPGRVTLDMSGGSISQLYQNIGGSDARLYPVAIHGYQQRNV